MYGLDGSYAQFVLLLTGYDLGWRDRDGARSPLEGFGQWLAARNAGGGNLVWRVLVLRLSIPDLPQWASVSDLDADQERVAVTALQRLLDEYLGDHASPWPEIG